MSKEYERHGHVSLVLFVKESHRLCAGSYVRKVQIRFIKLLTYFAKPNTVILKGRDCFIKQTTYTRKASPYCIIICVIWLKPITVIIQANTEKRKCCPSRINPLTVKRKPQTLFIPHLQHTSTAPATCTYCQFWLPDPISVPPFRNRTPSTSLWNI